MSGQHITVTYLGAMHCKGVGKNGNYDFCQVKYASPIKSVASEKRTVVAYGAEEQTVDLDPEVLEQFRELTPGTQVKLIVGLNPANLNRALCTGVAKGA